MDTNTDKLRQAREKMREGVERELAVDKLRGKYNAERKRNEEKKRAIEAKTAQAYAAWRKAVSDLGDVRRAEDVLVAEFRRNPENLEARRAPKRARAELVRLTRRVDLVAISVREGAAYVKRVKKGGALKAELVDLVKTQAAKESDLSELRAELDAMATKVERLDARHDDLWHAFLSALEPATA